MKTSRIACVAIATLSTFGSFARAESLVHIDELAVTAERQARQVLYQTYSLHAYGPVAQELKGNAIQMIRLAKHIHEVAHVDHRPSYGRHRSQGYGDRRRQGARIDRKAHINHDVAELDRLMHDMQDMVVRMKARIPARRPSFGHGRHGLGNVSVSFGRGFSVNVNNAHRFNSYYHGSSCRAPSTLDRIEISLAKLSETVHHLLDDTDVVCIRMR